MNILLVLMGNCFSIFSLFHHHAIIDNNHASDQLHQQHHERPLVITTDNDTCMLNSKNFFALLGLTIMLFYVHWNIFQQSKAITTAMDVYSERGGFCICLNLFFSINNIYFIDYKCASDVKSYRDNVLVNGGQRKMKTGTMARTPTARHDTNDNGCLQSSGHQSREVDGPLKMDIASKRDKTDHGIEQWIIDNVRAFLEYLFNILNRIVFILTFLSFISLISFVFSNGFRVFDLFLRCLNGYYFNIHVVLQLFLFVAAFYTFLIIISLCGIYLSKIKYFAMFSTAQATSHQPYQRPRPSRTTRIALITATKK